MNGSFSLVDRTVLKKSRPDEFEGNELKESIESAYTFSCSVGLNMKHQLSLKAERAQYNVFVTRNAHFYVNFYGLQEQM